MCSVENFMGVLASLWISGLRIRFELTAVCSITKTIDLRQSLTCLARLRFQGQNGIENMRKYRSIFTSIFPAVGIYAAMFLFGIAASAQDRDMVLEGIDGGVTTNEYKAFIDKLQYLPLPPTNNIGNLMVDERDGARLHGMQTFYAFTHDRRDLDMAIIWSDAFLHARNDPINGRIIWNGKRDLCWPNKATNDGVLALHSSVENGDVIEHIVNTARVILEDPAVWNQTAPKDRFGFGATYLDRAKTYVRECQRSADVIVPWFVRNTQEGCRLYYPDSAAYFKASDYHERGPIPWNQQQSIVGGLLRLAQCHRLLDDGNTNIAYYEKITGDAAAWFFATAMPVNAHDRACYDWAYVVTRPINVEPESTIESDYDMFILRAYQANLGPTRLQMQRLINTGRFVMYLGTNRIAGEINGMSSWHHERQYLDKAWIETSVLDHDFYRQVAGNILAIHEYWDNLAVEAAVLSVKHYWATNPPQSEPQEVLDPAKLPPFPQIRPLIAVPLMLIRIYSPASTMLFLWIVSGIGLIIARRFDSSAAGHDPAAKFITRVYLILAGLGVLAGFRLPAAGISWAGIVGPMAVSLLVLGLALQWYARIQTAVLAKANAAGATKDRLAAPYHSIWRLSYAGGLLAMIGLSLSFKNWASLLIMCLPACALSLWRIRTVPAGGKGNSIT